MGTWRLDAIENVKGEGLERPISIEVVLTSALASRAQDARWVLHGVMSNVRYGMRSELVALQNLQQPLGRPTARRAAMIPIKKSPTWWRLSQDERREIFEETSRHTAIGLEYLPGVARQLYHSRDLGEPFDFITWFEYAPEHAAAFEELVAGLRSTEEWGYVEREVDLRLELI